MFRLLQQLQLPQQVPLLLLLLLWLAYSTFEVYGHQIIHHFTSPDVERHKFIWNPFPAHCGSNATMVTCGGVCPDTCAYKSLNCLPHCGVPCVCRPGYVFNEVLLRCILLSDCIGVQQQLVHSHRVFQ